MNIKTSFLIGAFLSIFNTVHGFERIVSHHPGWSLGSSCSGCHGTLGHSESVIPSIDGMDEAEFVLKLREYKAGKRAASVMDRIARGYDDRDFRQMAIFFGAKKETQP